MWWLELFWSIALHHSFLGQHVPLTVWRVVSRILRFRLTGPTLMTCMNPVWKFSSPLKDMSRSASMTWFHQPSGSKIYFFLSSFPKCYACLVASLEIFIYIHIHVKDKKAKVNTWTSAIVGHRRNTDCEPLCFKLKCRHIYYWKQNGNACLDTFSSCSGPFSYSWTLEWSRSEWCTETAALSRCHTRSRSCRTSCCHRSHIHMSPAVSFLIHAADVLNDTCVVRFCRCRSIRCMPCSSWLKSWVGTCWVSVITWDSAPSKVLGTRLPSLSHLPMENTLFQVHAQTKRHTCTCYEIVSLFITFSILRSL